MKKMYPYDIVNTLKKGEVNLHVAVLSKEIEDLQKQFEDTDYKTTKNLQYERMGLELPYSWDEIYKSAEAIRVQIREREEEINNLLQLKETPPASDEETVVEETTESNE